MPPGQPRGESEWEESWTDASDAADHLLLRIEYVDTRAKEPLNSPYRGDCSCGWAAWKPGMESVQFAHALHVARMGGAR